MISISMTHLLLAIQPGDWVIILVRKNPAEPQYWHIIHTREESWTFIGDTWTVDEQVLEAGLML